MLEKNNVPKVLMLGWEFPPIINGGLGIACHDLAAALSEFAEITMVIPKSSREFKMKNVELIGINNIEIFETESYKLEFKIPGSVVFIPSDLNPYTSEPYSFNNFSTDYSDDISSIKEKFNDFSMGNLYGKDLFEKVVQYGKLVAAYAVGKDFDIIHAHDWMTMLAGMEVKARTGKPLVMHIHSLEVDRSGADSKGWVYELEKNGMEYADLLIPVSNFTADNIHKYYGIDRKKIMPVHNGISDVTPFKSPRLYDEKTVLFIGRLTRQKGPEYFLNIASKVIEKEPNVRFVMAGTGDCFRSLLEQSSYKNIGNRFHLTGFLDLKRIRYLLSVSDVYCMPSVSEPFGLSAVEAVQFGVPCVISKQSGVAEVLSGALKFDSWDINRAANYILSLLKDPVLNKKVTSDANENLQKICWSISARKVVDVYHKLIPCLN